MKGQVVAQNSPSYCGSSGKPTGVVGSHALGAGALSLVELFAGVYSASDNTKNVGIQLCIKYEKWGPSWHAHS